MRPVLAHMPIARLSDERGQGMVEYSLIIALVAIGTVGAVTTFGGGVGAFYQLIQTAIAAMGS